VFDFFNKLFKPVPPSGATAKERLRLVLLSDHLSLAPDVIEALKRDLLVVISRYVEIDRDHADVTFEHREGEIAMLASIPITGVRERTRDDSPQRPSAPASAAMELPLRAEPAVEATSLQATAVETSGTARPATADSFGTEEESADAPVAATTSAAATHAPGTRRRRRRKSAAAKRAGVQTVQINKPAQA
jgi:cell division topological specificity factor